MAKYHINTGKIIPTFLLHTFSVIFLTILMYSAPLIDGFFVGNFLGKEALGAINMCLPFLYFLSGINIIFIIGSGIKCSEKLAQKKYEVASDIFSSTLTFLTIFNLFLTALFIFFSDIVLGFLEQDTHLINLAKPYYILISSFALIFALNQGLIYYMRILNKPVKSFLILLFYAVLNGILDYIFIKMNLGLSGVALATGLSQIGSFIILIADFRQKQRRLKFTFTIYKIKNLFKYAYNGFSELLSELSLAFLLLFYNRSIIQHFGINGITAFTIITYFMTLEYMIVYAISDTLHPLLGHVIGRQNHRRAFNFFHLSIELSFTIGLLMGITLLFEAPRITQIFISDDNNIISICQKFANYLWLAFIFNGTTMCIIGYFSSINKATLSAVLSVLNSLILPVLMLWILPFFFGTSGIYIAPAVGQMISCAISCHYYLKHKSLHPTKT